jgi:apolipoprotein N-acyltransferase
MLCYEDMVPQAAREMVLNDANLLVSLANGSAFESHFTLYQHRLISHLRAIECRRYFLRCAATGETCVINPLGEIESRLPMQTDGALVSEVGLMEGKTIYSQFPWILPILGCAILASFLRSNWRRSEK